MRQRPDDELASLVRFARELLFQQTATDSRLTQMIDLEGDLGRAYSKSIPFAYYYPIDELPSNENITKDLCRLLEFLGVLYSEIELGRVPGGPSPEEISRTRTTSPLKKFGQGRGLSGAERRAIELHAMNRAKHHLKSLGFQVKDVSANHSFDILATNEGQELVVEVKGTTGTGASIEMTVNEVELHKAKYSCNALIVVSEINLERGEKPKASGGTLEYAQPWRLPEDRTRPTNFRVEYPLRDAEGA